MLSPFQLHWGIDQWVEFLKGKEIPVLSRTRALMAVLAEQGAAATKELSARELADYVYADPYLSLKLLRQAENRRSQRLGQETTTALAAVLQTGFDDLIQVVLGSSVSDDSHQGCNDCEFRAMMAASIARGWAMQRADVSPDEVALAALLSESGELLLWHFAPELPLKAQDALASGRDPTPLQAQQDVVGFSFRQLTLALVQAWQLPNIIALLIRGTDTPRASIARIAVEAARLIIADEHGPALPALLTDLKALLPGARYPSLIAPLPIADDYKRTLLEALTGAAEPPAP